MCTVHTPPETLAEMGMGKCYNNAVSLCTVKSTHSGPITTVLNLPIVNSLILLSRV